MDFGVHNFFLQRPLTGHDGLQLLDYLRADRAGWVQQYSLRTEQRTPSGVILARKSKYLGEKLVQNACISGKCEIPFEQALDGTVDKLCLRVAPRYYFPIGLPGIFYRQFVTFPHWIPRLNIEFERSRKQPAYQVMFDIEYDPRPLKEEFEKILGSQLIPVQQQIE
jgi:hypothetical protein